MGGKWSFLPQAATPFMVAAVRAFGPDAAISPPASRAAGDTQTVGRELLRLVFGTVDGAGMRAEALAELARDPASLRVREQLTARAFEVFESAPVVAAEATGAIAAFYRRRADAGEVQALVELGDFLYWDEPDAARAAYQEAIDAGHAHALIDLGMVLNNVMGDEQAALAAYDRAAASDDPDLRAEALYKIACQLRSQRDAAAAAAMFRRVISTRHPRWASAAMAGLADVLKRGGDLDGAEALYREAVEAGNADWSAHASCLLGDALAGKGDVAGATAAWQRVIDSGNPESAGPAFTSLVNLLDSQGDVGGLRAAYVTGAALDNPEAPYALLQLGQLLESRGDIDGAHEAWQQAIDAGCEDADYWRERMSPAPGEPPEPAPYPPDLPPEFDPGNLARTGIDVLEHGLLPLPDVLSYQMAIPVAYWKAEHCGVVLVLRFLGLRPGEPQPVAVRAIYSRAGDGTWKPPVHATIFGGGFSHDPIADPGSQRDLGGSAMVYGGGSWGTEITPGYPAAIATGRASPEVRYLAVIKDGHEDRRPLHSHFGAWVICTEQPGPFEVAGFDESGNVLARIAQSVRAPRR